MTIHSGADAPIVSNDANETPKRGRIDLTQFEGIGEWRKVFEYWDEGTARYEICTGRDTHPKHGAEVIAKLPDLLAELKRMYAREDELLDALRIIRNDLNEALDGPLNFLLNGYNDWSEVIEKIRNFANDASQ